MNRQDQMKLRWNFACKICYKTYYAGIFTAGILKFCTKGFFDFCRR